MKNWKSTGAFIVFVSAYIYSLLVPLESTTVEVAGYVALWAAVFMMLRNDMTPKIIEKIIDSIGKTK